MNIDKHSVIEKINNNTFLYGLSIVGVNFASKYINFTPAQQKIFDNPVSKVCIIFFVFYLSSKNVVLSVSATGIFVLFWAIFLNDESRFSLIPDKVVAQAVLEDKASYERALQLVKRYEEQAASPDKVYDSKRSVKDAYYATKDEVYAITQDNSK